MGIAAIIGTVISAGVGIFGAVEQANAAKKTAAAQEDIARQQEKQNQLQKQAADLEARRKQIETLRNSQRARSIALNNATSAGAQFGSGIQGGFGQIAGQTNNNLLGISQTSELNNQFFAANSIINQDVGAIAGFRAQAAEGAAFSAIGGDIGGSIGSLSRLFGGFKLG